MMPAIGHVADVLREAMPDKLPYVNLFPTYANSRQLGVGSYQDYVQSALTIIHPPFLSYDHYALVNGRTEDSFFTNMEIIRQVSQQAGIPFWSCILSVAFGKYMEPTDASVAAQTNAILAYGGRGIEYYTYTTLSIEDYRLGAYDRAGNRTPTWDMVKRANGKANALAPTFMHLRSTGVYHGSNVPKLCHPLAESRLVASVEPTTADLQFKAPHFLIGEFEDNQSRPYLMIVNADLIHSFNFKIHLRKRRSKLLWVSSISGQEQAYGSKADVLPPGGGMLFRVD
jgi:hypothetical protein